MGKIHAVLHCAGLPIRYVCDNIFGPNHTHKHRMASGMILMAIGVVISKLPTELHVEWHLLHYVMDGIGYMIHGIGAMPYGEALATVYSHRKSNSQE